MKRILFALMSLTLLTGSAKADTVYFKSGTSLECKVIGEIPEGLLVELGSDGKASLVLDRATILRIEYDFDSRLDEIRRQEKEAGQKLWLEHYKLGLWCEERAQMDQSMCDRALDRYLYAKTREGIPDEVWLRLGRMFEHCREPNLREALAAYQEYLRLHPDSGEAAAAIKRIEDALPQTPGTADPGAPAGADGMETLSWLRQTWGHEGGARGVRDSGNGNTVVLELEFRGGGKDKAAYRLALDKSIENAKALVFDIYNPENKPIKICVALVTGDDYEWYESHAQTVSPGKWLMGMRFDLTLNTWKSKATNWAHRTKPGNLNRARNLLILVYNGKQDGKLFVDDIRFE
jgi:hypothetical protein